MKNTFVNESETRKALSEFILTAPRLSMDEKCRQFELAFSKYQGRNHSILFNSGGSANLSLLQTLKNLGRLKDGDRIGISALTWATNVMPILQLNMVPVALDCKATTLNVMSSNLSETIKHTKLHAFFATNVLGYAGDLPKIAEVCQRENIIFIEDNCEALGTELPKGRAGNFGVAATFSFFVAHHMSTIEGGMICTNDEELAQMFRIVRANGWDRNLNSKDQHSLRKRHDVAGELDAKYTFYDLGFNFRPTEITGFLGLNQLKYLESNIEARIQNHMSLEAEVSQNPDLNVIDRSHISTFSPFAFSVLCKNPKLRDQYMKQFSGAGVEIRPMIAGNIQRQPFYKKYVKNLQEVKDADFIHQCGFYCGNYPELSETELETLRSCLRQP